MAMVRFTRYNLRTSDPDAARAFYLDVMGDRFWTPIVGLMRLPELAAARGAPPHWLGQVGVADVEGTIRRIVGLGGEQLGPTSPSGNGGIHAVFRDPFGAVLAVSDDAPVPGDDPVTWHLLLSADELRAFEWYHELFGWTAAGRVDMGPELGRYQRFAWETHGPIAGSVANTARLPHVHPQWLFCFGVGHLADTVDRIRARGGHVMDPVATPDGDLVAPCEDPLGAAFAVYQPGAAAAT
jgi:predicted enzyme related to lactoylglutathione lyase